VHALFPRDDSGVQATVFTPCLPSASRHLPFADRRFWFECCFHRPLPIMRARHSSSGKLRVRCVERVLQRRRIINHSLEQLTRVMGSSYCRTAGKINEPLPSRTGKPTGRQCCPLQ
jgi:hypothetical protein